MSAARIRLVARLGGTGSELSPWVVGSLVVHVLFVAALVLLPSLRPRKPFPDNPIVVDLVASARPAAMQARTPAPSPPAPEPTPPPEGVRLETREPPPVKPRPEKEKEKRKEPPKPRPSPPPPVDPVEEPSAPAGPPGVVGEGSSVTAAEIGDVRFAWYRDSVTAALYSNWRRPILDGLIDPVEVRVTFEILRDGSVRDLRVDQASGVLVFDRSALRAVSDAAPLPPLPGNWREPTLPAAFVFRLFPE